MSNTSPLTDQEKADLVALLDGELTGEAARALETKLSLDAGARAEADALKRTWDLLDFLPKPEPSRGFTHRTLEKITPIRPADSAPVRRNRRHWLIGAGWAAAVFMAVGAGYAGFGWSGMASSNPDQDLTRDLRIIENKRFYDHVQDLDFLKSLDQSDLFGDEESGS